MCTVKFLAYKKNTELLIKTLVCCVATLHVHALATLLGTAVNCLLMHIFIQLTTFQ